MAIGIETKKTAQALFDVAKDGAKVLDVLSDLRKASDLLKDEAVINSLQDSKLGGEAKKALLNERIGKVNQEVVNLIAELAAKDELTTIDDITFEYQRLVDTSNGVKGAQIADVTTAVPLDEAYKLEIGKKLTEIVGSPVVINAIVDESLIGGIIIRIGDKLIDHSIRQKLASLNKELAL